MRYIVRSVLLVAAAGICFAQTAPQVFDADPFMVDTSLVPMPVYAGQTTPRAAFDGTNYLVVWRNDRSGMFQGVVAARVSRQGMLLDLGGIGVGEGGEPAVAFDGANFLVVWSQDSAIKCARVSPAGDVLDSSTAVTGVRGARPAVAFDGTSFLVAWGGHDLYAARVSPAGAVLDTAGILVSAASGVQECPSVVAGASCCLVTWQDMRPGGYLDIYGARVDGAGAVLDPDGILVSGATYSQWYPVAAFDGTNFLVAWQDYRTTDFDVYAARVTAGGAVLDPDGLPIATSAIYQRYPSLTFGAGSYFVTWERWDSAGCSGIWGARVGVSGVPRDTGFCIAPTAQNAMPVAYGDGRFFATWQEDGIWATWVDTAGAPGSPAIPVYALANEQRQPAAAFNGTHFLVAWQDERPGDTADIRAIRLNPSGMRVDPLPFTISGERLTQRAPAVASDGDGFLVVWADLHGDTAGIFAARVSSSGVVLDTAGIQLPSEPADLVQPAVCWNGASYLVVWADERNGEPDIYAARISSQGALLDPAGFPVCDDASAQDFARVSYDGTNSLAVWTDFRARSTIFGARVDAAGSVLDPGGFRISPDSQNVYRPVVAFGSGTYFVAWEHLGRHVDAAFVSPGGAVLDSVAPVRPQTAMQRFLSAAFDGTNFVVVWELGVAADVVGATVSPAGVRLDTFAVAATLNKENGPGLAAGPSGEMLAVYSGKTDTAAGRLWDCRRVMGRLTPFTGVEQGLPAAGLRSVSLQVVPNPFHSAAFVSLNLTSGGPAPNFRVFDAQGRLVRVLPVSGRGRGRVSVVWDGADARGLPVPAGLYFVTVVKGGLRLSRAVTLVRD